MNCLREKIKIAFVLDQIDYQMGGTEKQVLMILDNIDQARFEIHLCFFRNNQWIEKHKDKYKIFLFDFPSFKYLKSYFEFFKFVRYLKLHKFDILVSFFTDSNKIAVPAARFAGISKIVMSRRNINHWVSTKELFILKFLNRFVSSYWVNSEAVKKCISAQENIAREKIEVIYNGFELEAFSHLGDENPLETIKQSKVVVNVSNLRPIKGLEVFIQSAKLVLDDFVDVHFVIIGEGDQREKLEGLIRELGIESNISLIGKRTDIPSILKHSDVGVLSSHSEGFSNAIIEYMVSGLPVVCTDVGGASEIISNGENGYLVSANDSELMARSILKLVENDDLCTSFGIESYKISHETFKCESMIENLSGYFLKLSKI